MKSSDWLIINPPLSDLADFLRNELELVAALDAKIGVTSAQEAPSVDPLVFRAFYAADEKLRKLKMADEADWILERYRAGDTAGALEYVEALLGDLAPEGNGSDAPAGKATECQGNGKSRRKASVNMRMADLIQEDPGLMGLTCDAWAQKLRCVKSTVAGTKTWKKLEMYRAEMKAKRKKDRHRTKKPVRDW